MMIGDIWLSPPMIPELSKTLGVDRTTIARWLENAKLPPAIYQLLDLIENGNLGRIHSDWDGWRINPKDGDLVTPIVHRAEHQTYRARDIFKMGIVYQHLRALKDENEKLRLQCKTQKKAITEKDEKIAELERYLDSIKERNVIEWRKRNRSSNR